MADPEPSLPRTYLYVPGDRPDRFAKAEATGTDAVVFDLEDAVALPAKDDARAAVVAHLATPSADRIERWVRINVGAVGRLDLDALDGCAGLTGVFVAKAEPDALPALTVPAVALVETATAVLGVERLARSPLVRSLAMGEVDLAADLGLRPSTGAPELAPIRMAVVVSSAAAGLDAPVGPAMTDLADLDELARSTIALGRAGFGSRQAIHPTQVAVINTALAPTAQEVDDAEQVVEAFRQAAGGVFVDGHGRMIDEAVVRNARRVLRRRR